MTPPSPRKTRKAEARRCRSAICRAERSSRADCPSRARGVGFGMDERTQRVSDLLHEAGEVHHVVYRITQTTTGSPSMRTGSSITPSFPKRSGTHRPVATSCTSSSSPNGLLPRRRQRHAGRPSTPIGSSAASADSSQGKVCLHAGHKRREHRWGSSRQGEARAVTGDPPAGMPTRKPRPARAGRSSPLIQASPAKSGEQLRCGGCAPGVAAVELRAWPHRRP
jgi:hypothetical protein